MAMVVANHSVEIATMIEAESNCMNVAMARVVANHSVEMAIMIGAETVHIAVAMIAAMD